MPGLPCTTANISAFDEFIKGLGLAHFHPSELRIHCEQPDNGLPPRELWDNISGTIGLLDEFRSLIGLPIMLSSVFRSTEYNRRIGGALKSNHLQFCACDWWIYGERMNAALRRKFDSFVRRKLSSGKLKCAGRGYYSRAFMHIDTNCDNGARPPRQLVAWNG